MALNEALRLIIDADAKGAVSAFQQVGKAAEKELGKSEARIDKVGKGMTKMGVGAIGAGVVIAGGLMKAGAAASDLGETVSQTNQIFDDASDKVGKFAKGAASSLGQSEKSARDAANTFGLFFTNAGKSSDEAAAMSIELTKLASDMASFKNTSPEQAVEALGAALRGESEPIRAYGVMLDDATLKQRALDMGLIKSATETLPPTIKMQAAYAEILAQTGTIQGDFARTSDGLANKQRILAAEFENAKAAIGQGALPVMTKLTGVAADLAGGFAKADAVTGGLVGSVATLAAGGLIAGGTLSTIAGKAIEMRKSFVGAEGGLTKLGKAGAALGVIGIAASIYSISKSAQKLTLDITDLGDASDDATADLARKWKEVGDFIGKGELNKSFQDLTDTNIAGAKRLRDTLKANGADVSDLDKILKDAAGSQRQLSEDQADATGVVDELTGSTEDNTAALQASQDQIDKTREAYDRYVDAVMGSLDAESGYRHAVDQTEDSLIKLHDAAVASADGRSKDQAANEVYKRQLDETADTIRDQADAAVELRVQQDATNGVTHSAADLARMHKEELEKVAATLGPDDPLRKRLNEYIFILGAIPSKITTQLQLTTSTSGALAGGGALAPGGGKRPTLGVEGFATGGVVPGPIGAPRLAVVHGGEEVLTPAQRSGSGGDVHFHVVGGVDPWLRAELTDIARSVYNGEHRSAGMSVAI